MSPASCGTPGPSARGSQVATPCYMLSQECSGGLASRSSEPPPRVAGLHQTSSCCHNNPLALPPGPEAPEDAVALSRGLLTFSALGCLS